jgi:hypothetical protein
MAERVKRMARRWRMERARRLLEGVCGMVRICYTEHIKGR